MKTKFTYRHIDGHELTVKEVNELDYDSVDNYKALTEDKIREVVRDVFNVPPAPMVWYSSPKEEVMEVWEKELREKLEIEVPQGSYEVAGMYTGKGGYIEFTVALHKHMRNLYDSQSYQK